MFPTWKKPTPKLSRGWVAPPWRRRWNTTKIYTGVPPRGSDGKTKFNIDGRGGLRLRKLYDDQDYEEEVGDLESGEESDSSMEDADKAQESEGSSNEDDEGDEEEGYRDSGEDDDKDGEFSNEKDDWCGVAGRRSSRSRG
ncbi:hypothetical protein CEP54_007365 [Fusarium duplospermum]|uniref:Uncharacterized protein n=1 Tax=Fusarium duplospermum TaxID=1325734 RepID=A0A428Q1Q4_9HYPO|nr:hypothetical protein CEP54_007365 [Fusarium duplospermum]